MRKCLALSIMFFAVSGLFFSCDKEEDPNTNDKPKPTVKDPDYYIKYDGKTYEVNNCFAIYSPYGSTPGCYSYTINIVPKAVTWNTWMEDLLGNGTGMIFEITTVSQNQFTNTTYATDTASNIAEPWEIYSPKLGIDWDFFLGSGTKVDMKYGTCTITRPTGNDYVIEATFTSKTDNKELKLYYKGSIQVYTGSI